MKTRMMRKIAVLVTGSALVLSIPVAGAIADSGGLPHLGSQGKAKPHTNKGKQNKQNGLNGNGHCPDPFPGQGNHRERGSLPPQAQDKGLKCGFTGGLIDGDGTSQPQNGLEQEPPTVGAVL